MKANFDFDMRVPLELDEERLLESDELGYLSLASFHVSTQSAVKLRHVKRVLSNVSYFEHDPARGQPVIDSCTSFCYSNQQVSTLRFLDELKEVFAESFLTQLLAGLCGQQANRKHKLRLFRLETNEAAGQSLEINANLEESTLIISMEKYLRPRLFDMMNSGRHYLCFLTISFDSKLTAAIQVNIESGQLLLHLLDDHFEAIRIKASSHQAIVVLANAAESLAGDSRFGANDGLHWQTLIVRLIRAFLRSSSCR
jgi:hypothetical protein